MGAGVGPSFGGDDIVGRRGRALQVAKERRNAFTVARQEIFLEHLATTCNVQRACAAAGVSDGCVYAKRRRDPLFRESWAVAMETGLARVEAMLIERATQTLPPEVRDGVELPPEPVDRDLALHLWREHRKGLSGIPAQRAGPQPAQWEEVEAHFIAKLKALKVRIDGDEA